MRRLSATPLFHDDFIRPVRAVFVSRSGAALPDDNRQPSTPAARPRAEPVHGDLVCTDNIERMSAHAAMLLTASAPVWRHRPRWIPRPFVVARLMVYIFGPTNRLAKAAASSWTGRHDNSRSGRWGPRRVTLVLVRPGASVAFDSHDDLPTCRDWRSCTILILPWPLLICASTDIAALISKIATKMSTWV